MDGQGPSKAEPPVGHALASCGWHGGTILEKSRSTFLSSSLSTQGPSRRSSVPPAFGGPSSQKGPFKHLAREDALGAPHVSGSGGPVGGRRRGSQGPCHCSRALSWLPGLVLNAPHTSSHLTCPPFARRSRHSYSSRRRPRGQVTCTRPPTKRSAELVATPASPQACSYAWGRDRKVAPAGD